MGQGGRGHESSEENDKNLLDALKDYFDSRVENEMEGKRRQRAALMVQCCLWRGRHSGEGTRVPGMWMRPALWLTWGVSCRGSWSFRTLETWMCSSRSGGRTRAATPLQHASAGGWQVPQAAQLRWSLLHLGHRPPLPPAWWLPWSCGGTATGATRRPQGVRFLGPASPFCSLEAGKAP